LGGVLTPPRTIIRKIGILVEMENNMYDSACCGAGGGVRAAFSRLAEKIGKKRIDDAVRTGAGILTTACPFCEDHLSSLGGIEVRDLVELVYDARC
jgi:Fe-S oxidoreductase